MRGDSPHPHRLHGLVRRALLLWIVGLLAGAGCGGDDGSGSGGPEGAGMNPGRPAAACGEDDPFGNACAPVQQAQAGAGAAAGGQAAAGATGNGAAGASATTSGAGPIGGSSATECASAMAATSRVIPNIYLLIDGSCSMELDLDSNEPYGTCNIDGPGTRTRWGALRRALVDPQDGLVPQFEDLVRFGFYLFGTTPTCPLVGDPLAAELGRASAIEAAFPVSPPGSNTPTGAALTEVVDAIAGAGQDDPDREPVPELLLLATDGAPNSCNDSTIDYQPSLDAARAARDLGVTMYVLSLAQPNGEFGAHLQEMADIGLDQTGAPVYSPNNPEELADVLETLIGGAVGCEVLVDGTVDPARACEGSVTLNGAALRCGEDWVLSGDNVIELRGEACDRFKSDSTVLLDASWPCGVLTVD